MRFIFSPKNGRENKVFYLLHNRRENKNNILICSFTHRIWNAIWPKYSTFRMYDATFRMYDATWLITHQPGCNTHQHGEYAPTWWIRTNLHSSISGRMMLTNAGWCVFPCWCVSACWFVFAVHQCRLEGWKTDGGGECPSTLPYGIP